MEARLDKIIKVLTREYWCCYLSGNQGQCNHVPAYVSWDRRIQAVKEELQCTEADAAFLVHTNTEIMRMV